MVTSGWASSARGDLGGEGLAVDGERAAGGQAVAVGGGDDQAAGRAHLPVQQADGVLLVVVGAEGVGADELGEAVGLVGEGADDGAHLVQDHGHADRGDLPGGLGAGEAAADDVDGVDRVMAPPIGQSAPPETWLTGGARPAPAAAGIVRPRCDRRAGEEGVEGAADRREVGEADEVARLVEADEVAHPGEGSDVGDRVLVAGDPGVARELALEHPEQAPRLGDVALAAGACPRSGGRRTC